MSLLLLGIIFKEEASANPAPAPNRFRGYYGRGGYSSSRVSGYKYGYGKRSAEPEPEADPYYRYGNYRYGGGKRYGYGGKRYGYRYYGYGKWSYDLMVGLANEWHHLKYYWSKLKTSNPSLYDVTLILQNQRQWLDLCTSIYNLLICALWTNKRTSANLIRVLDYLNIKG